MQCFLSDNEKKVLMAISRELINKNHLIIREFSGLNKEDIKVALIKLQELKLVCLDGDYYITTNQGDKYANESEDMILIKEEYDKKWNESFVKD